MHKSPHAYSDSPVAGAPRPPLFQSKPTMKSQHEGFHTVHTPPMPVAPSDAGEGAMPLSGMRRPKGDTKDVPISEVGTPPPHEVALRRDLATAMAVNLTFRPPASLVGVHGLNRSYTAPPPLPGHPLASPVAPPPGIGTAAPRAL